MSKKFNFDDAMRKRTYAASKGIGSKEWIEFAHLMFDTFPDLYEVARKMTVHQDEIWVERNTFKEQRDELLAAARFILKGMDGGHIKCSPYIDFDPDAAQLEFKHPSDWLREAISKAS